MTKTTQKRSARPKKSRTPRQSRPKQKNTAISEAMTHADTKQARAIEMLCLPNGASMSALVEATGWQQHSVRGFLAGVVRKRLKLNLVSAADSGVRTYRSIGEPAAQSSKGQGARSKSS